MTRQATMAALQEFAEREPGVSQPVDYDAEYGMLDLTPGAPLPDIQDRARLLYATFCPDGVPGSLQVPASERAMQIILAADRLSHYWRMHGAPPPSGRAAPPEGARQATAAQLFGAAAGIASAPPVERQGPLLYLVPPVAQPPSRADARRRAGSGDAQSIALRAAITSRRAPIRDDRPEEAPPRRPLAIAASAFLKLVLAALVVAAVVRVQQYRTDHPSLSVYSDPNAVIATGIPAERPVRWAGPPAPARLVIGAAAPAIAGHRRPE